MALNDVPTQPAVYKAKQTNAPLPEYDAMRARLTQRTNADTGQQQDAMARRFAAQGGLNTGAAIKQQQLVAEQGVQSREQGMEGINTQESTEQRRLQEIEANKEFQSQEAASGRQFQAGESLLGRQFQAGESQKGRDFSAGESKLGRDQQQVQFDNNQTFQDKWNTISQGNTVKQLDLAAKQFEFNVGESVFNKNTAMANMSDDELMGMGAEGAAYRETKARMKGENERSQRSNEFLNRMNGR